MIPFRTSVETDEISGTVIGLIIANVAVFLVQSGLPDDLVAIFIYQNALVPARFTDPGALRGLGIDPGNYLSILTNTFMHADVVHLVVNMWTLWLFGRPLEQRLGAARFVSLYLISGIAASLAHIVSNPSSIVPALGASGAIAGVLGAYTVLYWRARVVVLLPIVLPLIFTLPAVAYTMLWFTIQVIQGIVELANPEQVAGIAWWAHIGGFASGVLLVKFIGGRKHSPRRIGITRDRQLEIGLPRPRVVRTGSDRQPVAAIRQARQAPARPATPPQRPALTQAAREIADEWGRGRGKHSAGYRLGWALAGLSSMLGHKSDQPEASDAPARQTTAKAGPWG